jgi:hypothetical protein
MLHNARLLPASLLRMCRVHDTSTSKKVGFKPSAEQADGVVYEFGKDTACFLYPTPNARTSKASQAFWQVDGVDRLPS